MQVLEPGASVAVLDFNNNTNPLVDGFQEFALANAVVPLARAFDVAADYEYLRPSIKRFPTGQKAPLTSVPLSFSQPHTPLPCCWTMLFCCGLMPRTWQEDMSIRAIHQAAVPQASRLSGRSIQHQVCNLPYPMLAHMHCLVKQS